MSRAAGWTLFGLAVLALILVPFFTMEQPIRTWAQGWLRGPRPWWTAGPAISLLLAADVVLPVPSSVVATASGMLLGVWPGALASWLGMTLGCVAGYGIGARAGRAAAVRLVGQRELDRAGRAVERFGPWMIVVLRPVPVLAEASVLFAGTARMPWPSFLALAALSNLGISAAYAAVGAWSARVSSFLLAFAGAVLLPLAALLLARAFARG
jgi:uncharacterized membrane protein YdjX (TVP38/TMEM64 family)